VGDCCDSLWWMVTRNSSSYWWYFEKTKYNNSSATRHPLHANSRDDDWKEIWEDTFGVNRPWTGLYTKPGGTSRTANIFIGGGSTSVPASWNMIFGGSVEFDLMVSETPGSFGVFLGQPQADFEAGIDRSCGQCVYVEFDNDGLFATPAGGSVNNKDQSFLFPPVASGHSLERFASGTGSSNYLGYSGTSHTVMGKRTQIPNYEVSTKKASVRIEFWSRHARNWGWAKFHINDYHVFNILLPSQRVGSFQQTAVYHVEFTAGWEVATADDINEVWDDIAGVGVYPENLFFNTYDGQGHLTPSENCVYTVDNINVCYNSMTDKLIEERFPRPTFSPTLYGPSKSTGCPDPPDFEMFGVNVSEQTDLIPEGMQGTVWQKTPTGYANPDHRPNWKTWSGNFHGLANTPRYFDDADVGSSNQGMFYRTRQWAEVPPNEFSFTMLGQPYVSSLGVVRAWVYGSGVRVEVFGSYVWDGELAPPNIIANGTWSMTIWRTLWSIGEMENYTFGESGSRYTSKFFGTANMTAGSTTPANQLNFVQILYDEIWGSNWELSVSVD